MHFNIKRETLIHQKQGKTWVKNKNPSSFSHAADTDSKWVSEWVSEWASEWVSEYKR